MGVSRSFPLFLFVSALALSACSEDGGSEVALSPAAAAGKAYATTNCLGCHTVSGNSSSGPTWKGLYGSQVTLEGGATVTADDAYLTASILDPSAQIVDGYTNTMGYAFPSGSITQEQATEVVEYIKSVQ